VSELFELAVVIFLAGWLSALYGMNTRNEFLGVFMGLATVLMVVLLFFVIGFMVFT